MSDFKTRFMGRSTSARYIYIVLGLLTIFNLLWLFLGRAALLWMFLIEDALLIICFALFCIFSSRLYRENRHLKWFGTARCLFLGLMFLQLSWINIRVFNHLTMTTAFAYVDEQLLSWDRALGFDWLAYLSMVHDSPNLARILQLSYTSLSSLSLLSFILLVMLGHMRRAQFFIETFFFTAILCTAMGAFFPAKAASVTLIRDIADYPNFRYVPGSYHIEYMNILRAPEGPIILDPRYLPGLVTFPSFHTAAGILLCGAFWRTRFFPLALLYSTVMIASTPIYGGHYFIDLIAGTVLALAVMFVMSRFETHKMIFSPTCPSQ